MPQTAAQSPREKRFSLRKSLVRSNGIEFVPGLRHESALRICEDEMFEMLHSAGHVALSAQRARPLEIGFRGLGRRRILREDACPQRDRGTVLVPRALHARS